MRHKGFLGVNGSRNRGRSRSGILSVIIVLSTHLRIFRDPTLPCLPTHKGSAHGTGDHSTGGEDDGRDQHNPTTPS